MSKAEKKEKTAEGSQSIFTKETLGVVFMLFSTLSFICLVTRNLVFGTPGIWVNSFIFGCFGYFSYIAILYVFAYGIRLVSDKKLPVSGRTKLVIFTELLLLSVILQTISLKVDAFSYGEYLSKSYAMAEEGVKTCSAGGAFSALITYWVQKALSAVGTYIVFGVLFVAVFVLYSRSFLKIGNLESKFSASKEKKSLTRNSEEEKKDAQKFFVANGNDFEFKSKRELNKEGEGVKIGFEQNGLGVANDGSYVKGYTDDLQKKIEYIKTPRIIEVDKKGETYSSTTVSNYITPNKDVDTIGNLTKKDEITGQDIPFIEHDEKVEESTNVFDAYANFEEVEGKVDEPIETFRHVEPEKTDEIEKEDLTFIENTENGYDAESDYIEEKPITEEDGTDFEEIKPSSISERRVRDIFSTERVEKTETEKERESETENESVFEERPSIRRERSNLSFGFTADLNASEPKNEDEGQPKSEIPANYSYVKPPIDLLQTYAPPIDAEQENHEERKEIIEKTFADFRIEATVENYIQGPSVTRYEVKMPAGISVKKILPYDNDFKMWLSSKHGVRIEAPIPGKNLVGLEVANEHPVTVGLKEILQDSADKYGKKGALMFAIGKDIVGKPIFDNLSAGPHFLVAGATGSGKSVCLNIMIVSLIMNYSPADLRLILIDPKGNEFRPYEHIPHLLVDEIVVEPKKALAVLAWAHDEMERRYSVLKEAGGIRDIDTYNAQRKSNETKMPRIVIVVDELSNLMESCKKEMEARILAIAQKARAIGIHLVLATQRPSVDVITGTIKANLPSRIALRVTSAVDSGTILSEGGAEKLLGHGDMLYKNSSMSETERYQGAWISDTEINNVVDFIKEHNECYFDDDFKDYLDKAVKPKEEPEYEQGSFLEEGDEASDIFVRALWLAVNTGTVAISQLQRRFQIGYAKAGGLVDKMERKGFVSANEGSKARRVLLSREQFHELYGEAPSEDV